MPVFEYEARTIQGTSVKGRLEAEDETAVTAVLRSKNYFPVKIKVYREAMNVDLAKYKRVTMKDISIFCRQFSVVLSAGISILRALEIVREQSENPKLKRILKGVLEEVQKGKGLSESMKQHREFPDMLVNMISVGEASGTLDRIMDRMAVYYDKEFKLQQKIRQALTYPAIVSIFPFLVVTGLVVKVVPIFVGMLSQLGGELPLPTRIVMGISNTLRTQGLLIIGIISLLIIVLRVYFNSNAGREIIDKFKMNFPVFGKIYRKIVTARFARTFGILMGSGLPLIESITVCGDVVGNVVIKSILNSSREELKKGLSLGETLSDRGVFPAMLTQMIKIGEESGTLDNVLEKTAEFYDGEIETTTAQLTTMIEPLIIIVLAGIVGFIVVSIILPIFQMYSALG